MGLGASQRVADRYYQPRNLTALPEMKAQEGETAAADALCERAEDVIDGLVMEKPGAYSKNALVAISETYRCDFQPAARKVAGLRAMWAQRVPEGGGLFERSFTPRNGMGR